jgi:ABC-type Fe3+-siderophore transport system permease subunit
MFDAIFGFIGYILFDIVLGFVSKPCIMIYDSIYEKIIDKVTAWLNNILWGHRISSAISCFLSFLVFIFFFLLVFVIFFIIFEGFPS